MFKTLKEIQNRNYIEFQICKLNNKADIIFGMSKDIKFKKEDSLFILFSEIDTFEKSYNDLLDNGLLPDGNIYKGINLQSPTYYSKNESILLIDRLKIKKPIDYEIFIKFLIEASDNNGFYLLSD